MRKLLTLLAELVEEIGATLLFFVETLSALVRGGVRPSHVVLQMYHVGVRSVPTTIAIGVFVGAIMAIQINMQLKDFGAQAFLGGLSTSTTIRNVGPVLIAFLLSGKVGAFTSAELGTMRVTEQIDAIRCLGADPVRYLIVPRMVAVVLSSFLLLCLGLFMTIAGGMAIASQILGINWLNFLANIPSLVTWWSVGTGVAKSFVFGCLISAIACYKGYHTTGGAAGVGRTVRSTAVQTLVSIIVADFGISTLAEFIQDMLRVGWM